MQIRTEPSVPPALAATWPLLGLLLSLLTFALVSTASAANYLVRPDGTGDFPTIRAAITGAASGDTIELADGTFLGPDNKNLDFGGKALLVASESGIPEACVIDCALDGRGFLFQSGEDSTSVVRALTIRRGNVTIGAGIYCRAGSSPRITGCILADHFGVNTQSGVAIACEDYSSPIVEGCTFRNNLVRLYGTIYSRNGSWPRVTDCRFLDNLARRGGGVYGENGSATITNCLFSGGTWAEGGGILSVDGPSANLVVRGCTFVGNEAPSLVLAERNARLDVASCTFVENIIENAVVEITDTAGPATFTHTIIAHSTGGRAFDCAIAGIAELTCCDLYDNPGGDWTDCIAGQLGVDGNISAAPLLCDIPGGDYTLAENSPCAPENHPECGLIGAWPVGCGTGLSLELAPPRYVTYYPCGGTFDIDLLVADAVDLGAFELCLGYDGAGLAAGGVVIDSGFLGGTGRTVTPIGPGPCAAACEPAGVEFGALTTGAQPGASGSGRLAIITWERTGDVEGPTRLCFDDWSFESADVPAQPIAVAHTAGADLVHRDFCYGDFDDDGDVSIVDVMQVALRWGSAEGGPVYDELYDVDLVEPGSYCVSLPNGAIDIVDVQSVAARWGQACPGTAPVPSSRPGATAIAAPDSRPGATAIAAAVPDALTEASSARAGTTRAAESSYLRIEPKELRVVGDPGEQARFTIVVEGVHDLGAFETTIAFDPTVIEIEDVVVGSFLGGTGRAVSPLPPRIDEERGIVSFGAWTMGGAAGPEGGGILAEVTVSLRSCPGESPLRIEEAVLADPSGWSLPVAGTWPATVTTECLEPTAAPDGALPAEFAFLPSRPNPFGRSTAISFALPARAANVELDLLIVDASGRVVRRLASGVRGPGIHEVVWDGRDDAGFEAPSGTYFCRTAWEDRRLVQRMQLVR